MTTEKTERVVVAWLSFGLLLSIVTAGLVFGNSNGPPLSEATNLGGVFAPIWGASQLVCLLSLPAMLALGLIPWNRRVALHVGWVFQCLAASLIVADVYCFAWINEHVISTKVIAAAGRLETLWGHLSPGTSYLASFVSLVGMVVVALALFVTKLGMLRFGDRLWFRRTLLGIPLIALVLTGMGAWRHHRAGGTQVKSARLPMASIGFFRFPTPDISTVAVTEPIGYAHEMLRKLARRDELQLRMQLEPRSIDQSSRAGRLRDVVIVCIESLRPEMVDGEVMPTLARYAQLGIDCRHHFSGGNATTHGIFSLVNGLDAIWYSRPVRENPLLCKLLKQAGYEIGFFASHNDWRKFRMDGFINAKHFDVFSVLRPNWLASDRQATDQALSFLRREDVLNDAPRNPRAVLLYLYSTHANYHSYADDQVFRPAADVRFSIPYSKDAAPKVWNRYKNSARSVDRFLASVLSEDRVVIVVGDHGESFLEDGVCGHGTQITKYQNMTAAVVYSPAHSHRSVTSATCHADLLPTLLDSLGLQTNTPQAMDGISLLAESAHATNRVVATRDYLTDEFALFSSSPDSDGPFGYKYRLNWTDFQRQLLGGIAEFGSSVGADDGAQMRRLDQWLEDRFSEF